MNKYRHELKFICTEADLMLIESQIKMIMKLDTHTDTDGKYLIRSVYFDDIYHSCFYDNENGVDPRSKFRVRIYNKDSSVISLEKKSKKQGMTCKESVILSRKTCDSLLRGEDEFSEEYVSDKGTIFDEFIIKQRTMLMKPVVLIEYVRKPFVYPLGNVRVTFDMNISASRNVEGLFDDYIGKVSVLPTGRHILEVKYDDYLPDVLARIVNNPHLRQSTFSKYYLGCKSLGGRL